MLALISAAGVLGNWERPSSLSLLTRFTAEQLTIGGAGLLWAAAVCVLGYLARRHGWAPVGKWVAASGVVGAVILSATQGGLGAIVATPVTVWVHAVCAGAVFVLTITLASTGRLATAGTAMAFAPAFMSLLTLVEVAVGMLGPRPILVEPVMWASAAGIVAAVVAASVETTEVAAGESEFHSGPPPVRLSLAIAAGFAVLLAVVGMFSPGVAASVRGTFSGGEAFAADFVLSGWRTVGGWLALSSAGIALGMATGRLHHRAVLASSGATLVAGAAWFALRYTPLHTWMSWIPAEIQQDFGTEYAHIVFSGLILPWQAAALVLSAVVASAAAWLSIRQRMRTAGGETVAAS